MEKVWTYGWQSLQSQKNSLTEVLYVVLPQIHAASNKACKGHRQNVFLCLQNFLLWALNKKIRGRQSWCEGLESINVYRLVKNHNPMTCWALTHCWAKLHIIHMHEKTLQGFCEQIKCISNCSICNDWVRISPFLPLYAQYSMYCSQLLSVCRIKMLIFLYLPPHVLW